MLEKELKARKLQLSKNVMGERGKLLVEGDRKVMYGCLLKMLSQAHSHYNHNHNYTIATSAPPNKSTHNAARLQMGDRTTKSEDMVSGVGSRP